MTLPNPSPIVPTDDGFALNSNQADDSGKLGDLLARFFNDLVSLGAGFVPTSTTVNGHALTANVVVSASDLTIGTLPHAQLPVLLSADIPDNTANAGGLLNLGNSEVLDATGIQVLDVNGNGILLIPTGIRVFDISGNVFTMLPGIISEQLTTNDRIQIQEKRFTVAISDGGSGILIGETISRLTNSTGDGFQVTPDSKASIMIGAVKVVDVTATNIALLQPATLKSYTVATLPAGVEGAVAYATNGRKVGQAPTAGTGVPVYFSTGSWRVFATDVAVAA